MKNSLKKYLLTIGKFTIFVLPTLLAFAVSFIYPFIMGMYLSFCEFTIIDNTTWVGFDNFVKAFNDDAFRTALSFTTRYTVVTVITVNILAFTLAILLTKKIKGTNIFRTVFFMPNLIGGIVLGYIWQMIINGVLNLFDLTLTAGISYNFWGLVVLMNWQLIGYMMIIYIAGIQNIPGELIEAAQIDGATPFQILRKVTVPMVMPSVTICLFLTLSNSFKLFDQNYALTAGMPPKANTLAVDIYMTYYNRNNSAGIGQAKAVIFFLLVAVIAFTQLVATRRKEVEH